MTSDFTPADGAKPRWQHCYDTVITKEINEEITYLEIMELCECDRQAAQQAMSQALPKLEANAGRSVKTIANYGWIVMRAAEHLDVAEKHQHKSRRALKRSTSKITALAQRREELTQFQREAADRIAAQNYALIGLMGRRRRRLGELAEGGGKELTT